MVDKISVSSNFFYFFWFEVEVQLFQFLVVDLY